VDFGPSSNGLVIDLGAERRFSTVVLREAIREGQHIRSFKVEIQGKNGWKEIARGGTIGPRRLLTFPQVSARKLRVVVLDSRTEPKLAEVEVY
jgi:alpha-L-fucosidase